MRTPLTARALFLLAIVALASCASADRQFEKGLEHYKAGQYAEAIRWFDAALEREPESARTYLWRAHAFANLGDRNHAAADYRHAIELAPGQPDAHYGLGYLYVEMGESERALESFGKALAIDGSHYPSLVERAKVLSGKNRYEEAVRDLDRAIALKTEVGALYRMRGTAHMKLKQYAEALTDYDAAVALSPSDIGVRSERADIHYASGDYTKALGDLEFAVARAGKTAYPYNNLAWFLVTTPQEALRDGKRALMLIERAAQLGSETHSKEMQKTLHSTRAAIFAELGDFRSAITEQRKAIELAEQMDDGSLAKQRSYLETFKAKRRLMIGPEQGFY